MTVTLRPPGTTRITVTLPDGWVAHDVDGQAPGRPVDNDDPVAAAIRGRRRLRMLEAGVVLLASFSDDETGQAASMTVALRRTGGDADMTMVRAALSVNAVGATTVSPPEPVELPLGQAVRTTHEQSLTNGQTVLCDRFVALVDELVVVADFVTPRLAQSAQWLEIFSAMARTLELTGPNP